MADLPEIDGYNLNNPTKEIFQSCSGVFDGRIIGPVPYAVDIPNSLVPNTGVASTYPPTTTPLPRSDVDNGLKNLNLSSGIGFVGDMLVFNSYIHYDTKKSLRTFNPQSFLEQSLSTFNAYNFSNRTP